MRTELTFEQWEWSKALEQKYLLNDLGYYFERIDNKYYQVNKSPEEIERLEHIISRISYGR